MTVIRKNWLDNVPQSIADTDERIEFIRKVKHWCNVTPTCKGKQMFEDG